MHIGLIAGNGRFPFLVLDAARAQGHEVTVIATKEEAFPELNDAARRHGAAIHWISIGQLGTCISLLKDAGVTQAVMAGQVKHNKIFSSGIVSGIDTIGGGSSSGVRSQASSTTSPPISSAIVAATSAHPRRGD